MARRHEARSFFEDALLLDTDDCIVWPFATAAGYGTLRVDGRHQYVHVLAATRRHGPCPPGLQAAHGPCHNPRCFNPRHIRWATRSENQADRHRDGTASYGEARPSARLSADQVREIRRRATHTTQRALAAEYGVSQMQIYRIIHRQKWNHD